MKIYRGYHEAKSNIPPCVFAIGNFDGLHLGHKSLLTRARALASSLQVAFGVYTFWPHPQIVLHPDAALQLICTRDQKSALFKDAGVEHLVEEPFTSEFALLSAESFAKNVLAKELEARAVVVGENFRFGHGAEGTPQKLQAWLKNFSVECDVVAAVTVGHEPCSSSRIRELISQGLVEKAAALLGRPYSIMGTVVRGSGRGQSIGIPTANLQSASSPILCSGVFATRVRIGGSDKLFAAATNIGTRPTFSGTAEVHIETHLLDFSENIYGKELELFFVKKIRDERKFDSVQALVKQIKKDIAAVNLALT